MSIASLIVIIGVLLVPVSFIILLVSAKKNNQTSCPNCNQKLPNNTTYCTSCGQPVEKRN